MGIRSQLCRAMGLSITTQGGVVPANGPDVVKGPAPAPPGWMPMPMVNIAMLNQASGTTTKVKFGGSLVVTTSSKIPVSTGDEAGTAGGGMISAKIKGECTFKMGSMKVKTQGKMPVRMGDPSGHNGVAQNAMGMIAGPGCFKVMIA